MLEMSPDIRCHYDEGVFTPVEVEAMTGVSPVLQRTWKQRGFLAHRRGNASLQAREVAHVMTLQIVGQGLKTDFKFVQDCVRRAAPVVLWFALKHTQAWEIHGTRKEQGAFKKALSSGDMEGLSYLRKMLGLKEEEFGRFLVRRSDDFVFVSSLDTLFNGDTVGAFIFDLKRIGSALVESPHRPRALFIATDIEAEFSRG